MHPHILWLLKQEVCGAVSAVEQSGVDGRGHGGAHDGPDPLLLSTAAYDPVVHAGWAAGELAPYLLLARAFAALEATTKRLVKDNVLVNMFRSVIALSPGAPVNVHEHMAGHLQSF